MWALDTPYCSFAKPSVEDRIPVTNLFVVVDALVHCIDITSGRTPVHDPDVDHRFAQEDRDYRALQITGGLSNKAAIDWEWTVAEKKSRLRTREVFRAIGKSEEDDSEAIEKLPDVPGDSEGNTDPLSAGKE
jgi:hypothetical protein